MDGRNVRFSACRLKKVSRFARIDHLLRVHGRRLSLYLVLSISAVQQVAEHGSPERIAEEGAVSVQHYRTVIQSKEHLKFIKNFWEVCLGMSKRLGNLCDCINEGSFLL